MRRLRIERGITRKARHLVAAELAHVSPSTPDERVFKLSDLVRRVNQLTMITPERTKEFDSIHVKVIDVTEEVMRALMPQQEVLVR